MTAVVLPMSTSVAFTHAAIQALAEDYSVDVLHIKGPAVDDSLRRWSEGLPQGRRSIDADILVRPSQVQHLVTAMLHHGWELKFDFLDGSAFTHAATFVHEGLASVDLHRFFPGIGLEPGEGFERLWEDRRHTTIAGYPCAVPSISAQRLILLLHAARRPNAPTSSDVVLVWRNASVGERLAVRSLAEQLHAELPLAAAIGELDRFRGMREYTLWRTISSSDSSLITLWWARVSAAPTLRDAVEVGWRQVRPNRNRMAAALGRAPTTREILAAYRDRTTLGLRQSAHLFRRGRRR